MAYEDWNNVEEDTIPNGYPCDNEFFEDAILAYNRHLKLQK